MESAKIEHHLLQALTDALGNDEADHEIIFTFLIYIQLGIIKAAYPAIKAARKNAIELLSYLAQPKQEKDNRPPTSKSYDTEDIILLFENNKDTLVEIIEDIWATDNNPELQWMDTWVNNCRYFLKESDFKEAFISITKLSFGHFKWDNEDVSTQLLLNSFIQLSKSLLNSNKLIRIA